MIISWKNKKLQKFFVEKVDKGINIEHRKKLLFLLSILNAVTKPEAMNMIGYGFHPLTGNRKGFYAVKINANYRLTFAFDGVNAEQVDYEDYH